MESLLQGDTPAQPGTSGEPASGGQLPNNGQPTVSIDDGEEFFSEADERAAARLDAFLFQAPESPASYQFPYTGNESPEDNAVDMQVRQALHTAGVDKPLAEEAARLIFKAAENPPDAVTRKVSAATSMAQLENMWGADTQKNLELARGEVRRIAQHWPQLPELLEKSGVGNNPWIISSLAIRAQRRAMKGK